MQILVVIISLDFSWGTVEDSLFGVEESSHSYYSCSTTSIKISFNLIINLIVIISETFMIDAINNLKDFYCFIFLNLYLIFIHH